MHHQTRQTKLELFHGALTALHLQDIIRELTISERERQTRIHKTKTALTEIKAMKPCRNHNLKDVISE